MHSQDNIRLKVFSYLIQYGNAIPVTDYLYKITQCGTGTRILHAHFPFKKLSWIVLCIGHSPEIDFEIITLYDRLGPN
jgi:hypothetical protein